MCSRTETSFTNEGEDGAMNAAQGDVTQTSAFDRALASGPRTLLALLLAVAFAVPATSVLAQDGGLPLPKFSLGGEPKRKLTPEEEEQQKKIDADYKAATRKIPDQKANDPWADVRQAPASAGQKASPPNASAQKKKQSAQQAQ
jgi:hypothetical protein